MVYLTELWLPIVGSAVAVFVGSSLLHMLLTYHRADYKKLPNEDKLLAVLGAEGLTPGVYPFPYCMEQKQMRSPEMQEKYKKGPVGMLTVLRSGPPAMGKYLGTWFAFCVVMSIFVAYVTGRALAAGTPYLAVFRMAGTVAFIGYSASEAVASIWKGQPWASTIRHMFDGLVYALLTAGMFGWLWPR
jgi:hypothetical protein